MNTAENLIDDIRRHLDESVEAIDPAIAVKIAAARATAILEGTKGRLLWFWSAMGLTAAASVCIALLWPHPPAPLKLTPDQLVVSEIVSSQKDFEICKDLDLYKNMDFYAWLANNGRKSGG